MANRMEKILDKCERTGWALVFVTGGGISLGLFAGWIYWLICG